MTKFHCEHCGKTFNLYVNDKTLASFARFWKAEHRQCAAYKAALELFDLLERNTPAAGSRRCVRSNRRWKRN